MFTEILNIVVLLAKPTVVIVIVQAANCCYCSDPLTVVNVRSASAENTAVENTAVFLLPSPPTAVPARLRTALAPLRTPPTHVSERGPSDASVAAAAARTTIVHMWGHFASKTLPSKGDHERISLKLAHQRCSQACFSGGYYSQRLDVAPCLPLKAFVHP